MITVPLPEVSLMARLCEVSSAVLRGVRRQARGLCERMVDGRIASLFLVDVSAARLERVLRGPRGEVLLGLQNQVEFLAEVTCNHQFDILGSGLRSWADSSNASRGEIDAGADSSVVRGPNQKLSAEIASLIRGDYSRIVWNRDVKSGKEWAITTHSSRILDTFLPEVDIKVPWELGRMHHLVWLVLGRMLAVHKGSSGGLAERYAVEMENQILDFIASNPPRFGVHWACPMDVAIRAANWVVAVDLLAGSGWEFRSQFMRVVISGLLAHGRHVVRHLEWHPRLRGNHYLANVLGLLFLGAYLPVSEETDGWLVFAISELIGEVDRQFFEDGGGFEGSTCYHCLSAEMVVIGTAVVLGLPSERIERLSIRKSKLPRFRPGDLPSPPQWKTDVVAGRLSPFSAAYWDRVQAMSEFSAAIVSPDGRVMQVGDNDAGRFLKLVPVLRRDPLTGTLREDTRDRRHLLHSFRGLLGRNVGVDDWESSVDYALIRALVFGQASGRSLEDKTPTVSMRGFTAFRDFGLYIYRIGHYQCTVKCGPVGQCGKGGHAHNDQLAMEVYAFGLPWIVDSGTFVYTSYPEQRNWFRATAQHNTLRVDGWEQNVWLPGVEGLFSMRETASFETIESGASTFVGECSRGSITHRRRIEVSEHQISGVDTCRCDREKTVSFHLHPEVIAVLSSADGEIHLARGSKRLRLKSDVGEWSLEPSRFSDSYGIVCDSYVARLRFRGDVVRWWIDVQA